MKKIDHLSRRDFAKAAALTSAAAAILPSDLFAQQQKPAPEAAKEKPGETPKLSEASKAEADLAYETIIRKYGNRFTDEQKADIKRLVYAQQAGLEKLRAFPVGNSDQPATVFKPLLPEAKR